MRPPGSLISGIISLFELIKSNTLSVDHWHYNSKLFSFNKNSLTPIVTYPLSSRRGFIVLSTTIIFLNESFALSKDFCLLIQLFFAWDLIGRLDIIASATLVRNKVDFQLLALLSPPQSFSL